MKIEYQLTRKDLGDYNSYYYWKNKTVSAILGAIMMSVIGLMLINTTSRKELNITVVIICLTIGLSIYFLLIKLQLKKYGEYFKENGPMLTKKEVELTEQYFISTDTFSKVRIKWRAFTKVEAGKQGIYLFMESPLAVIIPKSTFENEVQVDKFINYVNERIKVNADMGFSF